MVKNIEKLPITHDYVFKRVFAYEGNESVLKDFLEAILEIHIEKLEVKNPEIIKTSKEDKLSILDIKVELNDGTIIDIEMQMEDEKNTDERGTSYLGKMISAQLQSGDDYKKLKKTIVIFITNFNHLERNSYHSVGRIRFDKTKEEVYVDMGYEKEQEIASKYIEVHYIE